MTTEAVAKKKKPFQFPHAYVLIVIIILVAGLLSYIIPAGAYDTMEVDGRTVYDPASFHYVEKTPVSPWDMLMAIPAGMTKQAALIFMLFIIAGSIEIINETGALRASIGRLAQKNKDKLYLIIPLMLLCFVAMGSIGVGQAILAFIPLGLLISFSLGGDALVAVALVCTGMNIGWSGGAFVATGTGLAQEIAGLPMLSGAPLRVIATLALWAVGSVFLIRYVKKLQKDPTASLLHGVPEAVRDVGEDIALPVMNLRCKLILAAFLTGIAFIVVGAVQGWTSNNVICGIFMLTGVACGAIAGFGPSRMAAIFVNGAKKMAFGALIVGIAAAISIVLAQGNIIDTVVHALVSLCNGLPTLLAAEVMYIINIVVNCFIVSGSGQAAAVIPILSPAADVLGITQQTMVLAFNFGDGLTNMILPMSAATMAGIGMGGIPYGTWLKWTWKWLGVMLLVGAVFIAIAVLTNYGPF